MLTNTRKYVIGTEQQKSPVVTQDSAIIIKIIDSILLSQDIASFSEVVGAGYEAEIEARNKDASVRGDCESETESLSVAVPGPSTTDAFEVRERHLTEIWEEDCKRAGTSRLW